MRQQISFGGKIGDLVVTMAEGNPGALTVLMDMLRDDDGANIFDVLHLDDMNMRGAQIWAGYKYACGQNLETFQNKIRNRDQEMIDKVNQIMSAGNGDLTEIAVRSGAGIRK